MTVILGMGTDIIEIERIEKVFQKYGTAFLKRVFTETEQAYCRCFKRPAPHLAVRFAAKEAVIKALNDHLEKRPPFHEIGIVNDRKGKPCLLFTGKAATLHSLGQMHISLSHSRDYAVATALFTTTGE